MGILSDHPWFTTKIYFSGIMRCDYIAEGVIKAAKELDLTIPLVVRLKGTKEAEAKAYVSSYHALFSITNLVA